MLDSFSAREKFKLWRVLVNSLAATIAELQCKGRSKTRPPGIVRPSSPDTIVMLRWRVFLRVKNHRAVAHRRPHRRRGRLGLTFLTLNHFEKRISIVLVLVLLLENDCGSSMRTNFNENGLQAELKRSA